MEQTKTMSRRLTRNQILENRAFVKALERTGNIRLAARTVGIAYGTIQHRRRHHAAFAQRVDAALAFAQARLTERGGARGAVANGATRAKPASSDGLASRPAGRARIVSHAAPPPACDPHRTTGGEAVVVALPDGRLQMRAAQPGKLTRECEQAFLAALSATANVRLSAAAAGASVAAFYRRRRKNPAFAREMRLALEMGYERIELALLASFLPDAHEDDGWRHNDPPPIPPMTPNQALQLLYLHQKEARLIAEPDHIKRRRGESREAHSFRLAAMYEADRQRRREAFEIAEAERRAAREAPAPHEPPPPALPALEQVTGWSKADPAKKAHNPRVALFGGWRLKDWKGSDG